MYSYTATTFRRSEGKGHTRGRGDNGAMTATRSRQGQGGTMGQRERAGVVQQRSRVSERASCEGERKRHPLDGRVRGTLSQKKTPVCLRLLRCLLKSPPCLSLSPSPREMPLFFWGTFVGRERWAASNHRSVAAPPRHLRRVEADRGRRKGVHLRPVPVHQPVQLAAVHLLAGKGAPSNGQGGPIGKGPRVS